MKVILFVVMALCATITSIAARAATIGVEYTCRATGYYTVDGENQPFQEVPFYVRGTYVSSNVVPVGGPPSIAWKDVALDNATFSLGIYQNVPITDNLRFLTKYFLSTNQAQIGFLRQNTITNLNSMLCLVDDTYTTYGGYSLESPMGVITDVTPKAFFPSQGAQTGFGFNALNISIPGHSLSSITLESFDGYSANLETSSVVTPEPSMLAGFGLVLYCGLRRRNSRLR